MEDHSRTKMVITMNTDNTLVITLILKRTSLGQIVKQYRYQNSKMIHHIDLINLKIVLFTAEDTS